MVGKLKTHRGAAKRFKRTAKGYKHRQSHRAHILTKKSTKRKRQLRGMQDVAKNDVSLIRRLLGD